MSQKTPSAQSKWLCWRRDQSCKWNNLCDSVSVSFQCVPPQRWAPRGTCRLTHSHKPSYEKTFQGRNTPALCVSTAIPAELLHTNLLQIMDFSDLLPSSMNDYCLTPVLTVSLLSAIKHKILKLFCLQEAMSITLQCIILLMVESNSPAWRKTIVKIKDSNMKICNIRSKIHQIHIRECTLQSLIYCLPFGQWVNQIERLSPYSRHITEV